MPKKDDLTGRVFGKWKVLCPVDSKNGCTVYLCVCECGEKHEVFRTQLVSGGSMQCRSCASSKPHAPNKKGVCSKGHDTTANGRNKSGHCPQCVKAKALWYKYRITLEEQTQIDEYQKNHPVFKLLLGKRLGTDHNHKTGLIRGLLEWRLNRAYGLIEKTCPENTAAVLRALADFHENPPATIALGGKRFGLIGKAMSKKKPMYGSENGPIKAIKKVRKCKR